MSDKFKAGCGLAVIAVVVCLYSVQAADSSERLFRLFLYAFGAGLAVMLAAFILPRRLFCLVLVVVPGLFCLAAESVIAKRAPGDEALKVERVALNIRYDPRMGTPTAVQASCDDQVVLAGEFRCETSAPDDGAITAGIALPSTLMDRNWDVVVDFSGTEKKMLVVWCPRSESVQYETPSTNSWEYSNRGWQIDAFPQGATQLCSPALWVLDRLRDVRISGRLMIRGDAGAFELSFAGIYSVVVDARARRVEVKRGNSRISGKPFDVEPDREYDFEVQVRVGKNDVKFDVTLDGSRVCSAGTRLVERSARWGLFAVAHGVGLSFLGIVVR